MISAKNPFRGWTGGLKGLELSKNAFFRPKARLKAVFDVFTGTGTQVFGKSDKNMVTEPPWRDVFF